MTSLETIKKDMTDAMKARDDARVLVLRSVIAGCTNELVAQKKKPSDTPTDEDVHAVLKREIKKRKEAIEQFTKGGRSESALIEEKELQVLEEYMPETMPEGEIEAIARRTMAEQDITSASEKGKLIGALMRELGGKADGGDVARVVSRLLS